MTEYKATAVVTLTEGLLRLSEKQAAARSHLLKPVKKGRGLLHEIMVPPVQFKAGETFGWDGVLPKVLRGSMEVVGKGEDGDA